MGLHSQANATEDPLFYGSIRMSEKQVPQFASGKNVLDHTEQLMAQNKNLSSIVYASDSVMEFFNTAFPELVFSNQIGTLSDKDFELWDSEKNHITIEVDTELPAETVGKNVYIGGPAALFAAALDANRRESSSGRGKVPSILYGHNGCRGASNWKGSASYFHVGVTVPVYYWADNTGPYVAVNTLFNRFKRRWNPVQHTKDINTDPNFNKLNTDIRGLMKDPYLLNLCLKNTWYTIKDSGLPITRNVSLGPFTAAKEDVVAFTSLQHAQLARTILPKLTTERPLFIGSNDYTRAVRIHLGETDGHEIKRAYAGLIKYFSKDATPLRPIPDAELLERGYDLDLLTEAGEFADDGYFPPYVDEELEKKVLQSDGEVKDNMLLKTILVTPTGRDGDCKVSRVIWQNSHNGRQEETAVNELYLSLGPSAQHFAIKAPAYALSTHLSDLIWAKLTRQTTMNTAWSHVYQPNIRSLTRHAWNSICKLMGMNNLLRRMMLASALSSVILVKIDSSQVPQRKIVKFRDHLNGHNKHIARLAEKLLTTDDGKQYHLFALQLTAGGNFPNRYCHPEAILNAFRANTIPLLGLEDDGIEFDIISARSCARGVTAENIFRVTAPFKNMVQMYGLGGIGMTTMAPNGVLMKAVMKTRQQLGDGKISETEFHKKLQQSDFDNIPGYGDNPFSTNFARFFDDVRNPRKVCRKLGFLPRSDSVEKLVQLKTVARVFRK